ncbi:MAG TPA: prenyltransferase [Caldisericia bacterium]|nr:prenyltransferase [Caldisericia bacterium]HQG60245.1 prenyltransferase [Caldisericia bacterium]HQH48463.1 prenyltransferase [Caldisericia bacterium]HQJ44909.1 prenyltransferase [Caldisericia bacterium]
MKKFANWFVLWFKAARTPFLITSLIPSILAGMIARSHGLFSWLPFVLATVGVVMAHSAGDFFDDYYDFKKGVLGHKDEQFHDSPLIDGKVTPGQVLAAGIGCAIVALACGAYFLFTIGLPVVYMAIAGGIIAVFYTAPPISLNFRGFGETALFFAFGPLVTLGVYVAMTGTFSYEALVASIPLGLLTMNIGFISNIFDVPSDTQHEKITMAVRLGQKNSVVMLAIFEFLAFAVLGFGVIINLLPVWTLIALIMLPLAASIIVATSKYQIQGRYVVAMTQAIMLTTFVGILMILGYI